MFGFVNKRCVVIVAIGTLGSVAQAQRAGTTGRDSVGDAAAALLNQGRPNEARMTLLQAMRSSTAPAQLATYRLELGDTFLFEGTAPGSPGSARGARSVRLEARSAGRRASAQGFRAQITGARPVRVVRSHRTRRRAEDPVARDSEL